MAAFNVNDILEFAIEREQEAHDFYVDLANQAEQPGMKDQFLQFAREEAGHKKKLESIQKGGLRIPIVGNVMDLKISDYLIDVEPSGDLTYQEALIVAMKREKAAFRLYTDLAVLVADEDLKRVFLALAQEEAKHKLRFELEYDDRILREN
jgi:rubrerythrin